MGAADEKTIGEEKNQKFGINDFVVIKEGEAEILMHPKNEVFYNKAQVNNRDMSIAVLRTFILKRQEEHDEMWSRRKKKVLEDPAVEPELVPDTVVHIGKSNGECEASEGISKDEPCSISAEPVANQNWKTQAELKPPRVLEALSASGLRALRYAREVDGIGQVVALDNDKANFARAVASLSKAQAKKVARFLPNPEKHWGPKLRAGRTITSKHVSLLGADAINGMNNNNNNRDEEGDQEEPPNKRKKTEEDPTPNL